MEVGSPKVINQVEDNDAHASACVRAVRTRWVAPRALPKVLTEPRTPLTDQRKRRALTHCPTYNGNVCSKLFPSKARSRTTSEVAVCRALGLYLQQNCSKSYDNPQGKNHRKKLRKFLYLGVRAIFWVVIQRPRLPSAGRIQKHHLCCFLPIQAAFRCKTHVLQNFGSLFLPGLGQYSG